MEVVEALEDQRRVDRTVRNVRAEVEHGRPENLDVAHALGRAPRTEGALHVGHRLERLHRRCAPRDHRREVAAPGTQVERPTVALGRPDLLDERPARVIVLFRFGVAVDLIVVARALARVSRLVEETVYSVEPGPRALRK